MHARNVIAFFVWAWPSGFSVPHGEILHEEALFVLTSERWEYSEDAFSRLDFASPPYISSSLGMARPFTNKVETGWKRVGKNVQTLWWAELDQLHSMTHAHPPLSMRCSR